MSWLTETGSATWTRKGALLYLPCQELRWQPGQSSILYLHFENLLSPENSRGRCPVHCTCVAKMSLDRRMFVLTGIPTRAHRWVEIPPGTISMLKFFVRMASGEVVDLVEMGCSISFILTIAPRSAGG